MTTIKLNASGETINLKTEGNAIRISMTDLGEHTASTIETNIRAETARVIAANLIELASQCEARRV